MEDAGKDGSSGLIYVLTNAAMPGLVKIGVTFGSDPESRAAQLYSTGVPVPFDVEFAGEVADARRVERALHNAFREHRINPRREFFRIEPDQPVEMLKAFAVVDVTESVSSEINEAATDEERQSRESLRARRPALNFEEMGIPVGSELVYADDPSVTAVVADSRRIEFRGEIVSLSAVTRDLKQLDYYVQPTPHWMFNGRSLRSVYNETYPNDTD